MFRIADINDTDNILNIYSQYINSSITFEYCIPALDEFRNRIKNILEFYPYIIYEEEGKILSYAYAHKFMERAGAQWNAELSVYVDKNSKGNGIGKKMYSILIEILKLQGIKSVYGCVTAGNIESEKMHESMGFSIVMNCRNVGYKEGKWNGVILFQKSIGEYSKKPEPVVPFKTIEYEKIKSILEKF